MTKLLWNITEIAYLFIGFIVFSFCFVSNDAAFSPEFRTECLVYGLLMMLIGLILDRIRDYFYN